MTRRLASRWVRWWTRWSGTGPGGRVASRFAAWGSPPFYAAADLATVHPKGYTAATAVVHCGSLTRGTHTYVGDRVIIYGDPGTGGSIRIGDRVRLYHEAILDAAQGATISIGDDTQIHTRTQLTAVKGDINIGRDVQIAANCALFSYNHGIAPNAPIMQQPVVVKSDIVVDDGAWIGTGVTVLSGVRIGKGAVIGAGAVVTHDIPDGAIAVGVPARVIRSRGEARETVASHDVTDQVAPSANDTRIAALEHYLAAQTADIRALRRELEALRKELGVGRAASRPGRG